MPSRHILRCLVEEIRSVQRAAGGDDQRPHFSTGIPPLDALLPGRGLCRGMLVEWLSADEDGSGAALMGLLTACSSAEFGIRSSELKEASPSFRIPHSAFRISLVVIDCHGTFYPPAAAAWGVPLASIILLRPANARDEAWALDQAIRSPAVAAVLAWPSRLDDRAFRRLQLAAESSGTIGVFVRPSSARREPTWADARFRVGPLCQSGPGRVGSAHQSPMVGTAHSTDFRFQISDFRLDEDRGWRLRIERLHARGCTHCRDPAYIEIISGGRIREITPEEHSSTRTHTHKPPILNLQSAI